MVTWFREIYRVSDGTTFRDGVCLSTDSKPTPTDMGNGSRLEEMDTGAIYRYDSDGGQWVTPESNNAG